MDSVYIALRHRHHFGLRTEQPIALAPCNPTVVDFTNTNLPVYGTNARTTIFGAKAMIAGDANRDGQINAVDKNTYWRPQNGQSFDYFNSSADFNMDGAVNAVDKNIYWRPNNSKVEQLD